MKAATNRLAGVSYGDLVWDTLDNRLVRYAGRTWDGFVKVMDCSTLVELPDYRHETQVWTTGEKWAAEVA